MKTFTGLVLMTLLLAASISAMPQRRRQKSQRQVELVNSTPYPAAGFRPRIAFDLPSEVTTTTTTTTAPISKIEVEEAQSTTEQEEQEEELSPRTPANSYGAPEQTEDTVEVAAAPAKDFQPPVREAVEDFAAVAIDGAVAEQQPVADLPALDQVDETPLNENEEELTEVIKAATPASTYGAPNNPANTYGPPELEQPTDNELEVEESQVELVEETEQELINEATLNLNNGRLIFLPVNAAGRLILAVEQPKQKSGRIQRLRSQRLQRRN